MRLRMNICVPIRERVCAVCRLRVHVHKPYISSQAPNFLIIFEHALSSIKKEQFYKLVT